MAHLHVQKEHAQLNLGIILVSRFQCIIFSIARKKCHLFSIYKVFYAGLLALNGTFHFQQDACSSLLTYSVRAVAKPRHSWNYYKPQLTHALLVCPRILFKCEGLIVYSISGGFISLEMIPAVKPLQLRFPSAYPAFFKRVKLPADASSDSFFSFTVP
ncbi:hypothetical protein MTO96_041599 [Rhipicephalus appendiculatus]